MTGSILGDLRRLSTTLPGGLRFLRGEAAADGHMIGPNDCWIAACCVGHGLPLLTRNRKHFQPLEPLGLVLV
jgi:predicted nucleic acid-binding protein